ncbi:MAG TPA: glycosyltransferase [Pyrinomonadaceae bacterium]|nr:glycosyltransferase [Pyrinomonadaceae bacterium]
MGDKRGYEYWQLKSKCWRSNVIHAHFGPRGWESVHLKESLKIPLITSFYGADAWMLPQSEPIWLERYRELFNVGDAFLVEGPAMRERLVQLGCPAAKVKIQRIGVDLSALTFVPKTFSQPLRIVMVGRFTEKKGLADGLQACIAARSRGVDLGVTIIGDTLQDDAAGMRIKRELAKLAQEPELFGRLEFTGFLPLEKTREIIRAHDVFLCPSRHAASGDAEGGSPVSLTEAMALGLICVGTRHCDIPEVIVHGQTGYLCAEGDVAGMAEIIYRLTQDPCDAMNFSAQGRKHVEERFSIETQLQRLSDGYSSLVHVQGRSRPL